MKKENPKKTAKAGSKVKDGEEFFNSLITNEMLIKDIARESSRSVEVVREVLHLLFYKGIPEAIKSGRSFNLPSIGSFHPITTIFTKEEEKKVSLINLSGVWIKFKPAIEGLRILTDYD